LQEGGGKIWSNNFSSNLHARKQHSNRTLIEDCKTRQKYVCIAGHILVVHTYFVAIFLQITQPPLLQMQNIVYLKSNKNVCIGRNYLEKYNNDILEQKSARTKIS
jgi:hypothetical protein